MAAGSWRGGSGNSFVRAQATKARFLMEAPGAGVLHLATHGEFPDDNAMANHSVWLAPQSEGGLAAAEVRRTNLTSTRLVVLSVCNGGLYRIGPADEPYGLIPAFLEAGAQNVVGTLWRLDDWFGRAFMTEFYRQLPNAGPAAAYRKAATRFIDEGPLRNWAAFVLVGPGRPFLNSAR
jgi:CHAT domain-containing protein